MTHLSRQSKQRARIVALGLSFMLAGAMSCANALNNGAPAIAAISGPQGNQVASVEPLAGRWHTWLLSSGDQFRLPAPPDKTSTQAEIKTLKALVAERNGKALGQIAFWNTGAPAYRWNELLINEALKRGLNSQVTARMLASMHAAISDATVAAWDSKYAFNRLRPSAFDKTLTTAIPNPNSPSYPSEHAVTAGAASAVLAFFFTDDAKRFTTAADEAGNAFVIAGVQFPSDVLAGLELGRKVADLAIARAKADGADAKWTGSVPKEPGHWTGENPILPMLGTWKTWVLKSGSELRPPAPPAYDSPEMAAELKAVETFSRTPKSNGVALFWEYGAGGLRNFQFWNDQLSRRVLEHRLDDNAPRAARAYALTSIAYYDSVVACWDAKYAYWTMRPFQLNPNFKPLFTTPNHPSYPSAHSCLSGAAAAVLANLFPRDGEALTTLVTQLGDSRVWGGIHFPIDVKVGQELGRSVAQKVIERATGDGS